MAIDFPSSPTVGQTYTASGKSWQWNGTSWASLGTTILGPTWPTGSTGSTGSVGPTGPTGATTNVTAAIQYVIDGGGAVISTGIKGDLQVPFACTITSWTIMANASGSIVVDIWKDTPANFPPTVADTITAAAKPTLSSQTNASSSTLTGWTTSIAANDILRFNVDSATTVSRITISLTVTRA